MPKLPSSVMPPGRSRVLVAMAILAGLFGVANLFALLTGVPTLVEEKAPASVFVFVGLVVLPLFVATPLGFAFEVRAGRPRALSIGISWWVAILILDALVLYGAWYQASSQADGFDVVWFLGPGVIAILASAAIAYLWRARRALRRIPESDHRP